MAEEPEPLMPFVYTEELEQYATNEKQRRCLAAVIEHGNQRDAAAALGIAQSGLNKHLKRLRAHAAVKGYAPGHFEHGTPEGFKVGKVTLQIGPNGEVERAWPRMAPDGTVSFESILQTLKDRISEVPAAVPALLQAAHNPADRVNMLGLFDLHIGEQTCSDDPLERWDLQTARSVIVATAKAAMLRGERARTLVLTIGGDANHYAGKKPVTPRSQHVLHASGEFEDMMQVTIEVAIEIINFALALYDKVILVWIEGNHDDAVAIMMRKLLQAYYRNEPRLQIEDQRGEFWAVLVGKVMLCFHHGHGAKLEELAGKFANLFRSMWGLALQAYAHMGHYHHYKALEKDGLVATQHRTLSPTDDYARSRGLKSRRGCLLISYDTETGEEMSRICQPPVFEEAADLPLAA